LETVCAALATALRPNGKLILTLELLANPRTGQVTGFSPKSRHAHSAAYVTRCLTAAGFEIGDTQEAVLRQERDRPVTAQCLVARRLEITAEEGADEAEVDSD
jgi:predicted TPR repeat methyltransferase